MIFDPTITWGAVLNAIVLLIGFAAAFTRIGGRIDILAIRMKAVETAINDHKTTETRIALLEERVTNHSKQIGTAQEEMSALRRGQGFIRGARATIDGEYN